MKERVRNHKKHKNTKILALLCLLCFLWFLPKPLLRLDSEQRAVLFFG